MFDADVGEDVLSALITLLLLVLAIACFVGGWLAHDWRRRADGAPAGRGRGQQIARAGQSARLLRQG